MIPGYKQCLNNLDIVTFLFSIRHDYHQLLKRNNRAYENLYHIFKLNNFRDVQNIYQDKASMDISGNKIEYLTYTCWDEKSQLLTIDATKDIYTGLDSL